MQLVRLSSHLVLTPLIGKLDVITIVHSLDTPLQYVGLQVSLKT